MRKHCTIWTKTRRALRAFACGEEGTQLIEFALAFPFLLFMFAGAIEMGRLFQTYTTLTKATDVGARYLSSPVNAVGISGYDATDIAAAKNLMVCGVAASCSGVNPIVSGFSTADITITPPPLTGNVRYVTVTISYTYTPKVFNLAAMGFSGPNLNYTLTPQTTMRYLRDSQ
jgi:Flp pilus assembly protein TadG